MCCCWCMKILCTLFVNLTRRMCNDIVDMSCNFNCFKTANETDEHIYEGSLDGFDGTWRPVVADQNEFEIRRPAMERETYFRAVDRLDAEKILENRVDGSCLVRPFKDQGTTIKYIVTIYAKNNYFHLFIRHATNGCFAFGLEKPFEKHFRSPIAIINYYRLHEIKCMNRVTSVTIFLVPIT